ncbi:50S ribosomal protein L20 [Thalassoglobus neptunius]|uniref:Large ribosomal subunit protein bL20 n=1 Tax=Thalassoglobus neptunius TaxID=1938619 RepID=A0A5C5X5I0_9PLAN|nr:50S ribosomal protein L20 [Thalassoglobus neptunius]TWT57475.1 50S ribosomal protein L20 [Thalassoglobus neptunius]
MRVSYGKARRRKKKRLFKEARGNFGGRSKLWRTVQETVLRSRAYAYRDRRVRKRDFRALWITRITAAVSARGLRYSQFIYGLKLAQIELNRKMLSEIAIHDPEVFDEIVSVVKEAIEKQTSAAAAG